MNQQKIGLYLRELRKDKQLTQAQLAEILGVSNRTVSRWETGVNMPDFDVLIEIAEFYGVPVQDILEGEQNMNATVPDNHDMLLAADYTNQEKQRLNRIMRIFFLAAIAAIIAVLVLSETGASDTVISGLLGAVTGVLVVGVLYTTQCMMKIRAFKLRLLNKLRNRQEDHHVQ